MHKRNIARRSSLDWAYENVNQAAIRIEGLLSILSIPVRDDHRRPQAEMAHQTAIIAL